MKHRRFLLVRQLDVTGISGTGEVAEGIQFSDGTVALRWLTTEQTRVGVRPTTVLHVDIGSVMALHGHDGSTTVQWLDRVWPGREEEADV